MGPPKGGAKPGPTSVPNGPLASPGAPGPKLAGAAVGANVGAPTGEPPGAPIGAPLGAPTGAPTVGPTGTLLSTDGPANELGPAKLCRGRTAADPDADTPATADTPPALDATPAPATPPTPCGSGTAIADAAKAAKHNQAIGIWKKKTFQSKPSPLIKMQIFKLLSNEHRNFKINQLNKKKLVLNLLA